jgi:sortase B
MNQQQWSGRPHSHPKRKLRGGEIALLAVSVLLLAAGIIGLTGVFRDHRAAEETNREQREIYYAEPENSEAPENTEEPDSALPEPSAGMASGTTAGETKAPDNGTPAFPADENLPPVPYPGNPSLAVSDRFQRLKAENPDIIGWIRIGKMLDEAVVQRNNTFYMDHDSSGRQNVNGAVFLDEAISLETRPYTLILYGHNMKSGARFGCLRNYENTGFYTSYPFIIFNTRYEDGEYVVFSACVVRTETGEPQYLDLFRAYSRSTEERRQAIELLKAESRIPARIDVRPEDQLLLLVTCVESDEERRVVAARRIRDGENRETLLEQIQADR